MLFHPLILAISITDLISLCLLTLAAVPSIKAMVAWDSYSDSNRQLQLETSLEIAIIYLRIALASHFFASWLVVLAISNVLPEYIPGAMCGTGTMQAMYPWGYRALTFRALVFFLLLFWRRIDQVNRLFPLAPLTQSMIKIQLLILPFAFWSYYDTYRAFFFLDSHEAVNCCAQVYSQITPTAPASYHLSLSEPFWAWSMVVMFTLSFLFTIIMRWHPKLHTLSLRQSLMAIYGLIILVSSSVITISLLRIFSAYYYGVLSHHCPWCLFLPEYGTIGFLIFLGLILFTFEGGHVYPWLQLLSYQNCKHEKISMMLKASLTRTLIWLLFLAALILGPSWLWRIQHGVWLHAW